MISSHCLFIVSLFLSSLYIPTQSIQCKDDDGALVDWFIAYKLPKDNSNENQNGFNYGLITSKYDQRWKLSTELANSINSIWGRTLSPLYLNHRDYTYLTWNDDPPNTEGNSYYAHSKGVIAMDSKLGFWLIHSVPNFSPLFNQSYNYPETGRENGQLSICITFSTQSEGSKIVQHLTFLRPNVYDSNLIGTIPKDNEHFKRLVPSSNRRRVKGEDKVLKTEITGKGGKSGIEFLAFSKPPKVLIEIYSEEIAPTLESDLYTQTWRRGAGGILNSTCPRNTVDTINIKSLNMPFNDRGSTDVTWEFTSDHSKWAITANENGKSRWTCIGDINRMRSQFKRGGGVVCMKNNRVWTLFKSLIKEIESCS